MNRELFKALAAILLEKEGEDYFDNRKKFKEGDKEKDSREEHHLTPHIPESTDAETYTTSEKPKPGPGEKGHEATGTDKNVPNTREAIEKLKAAGNRSKERRVRDASGVREVVQSRAQKLANIRMGRGHLGTGVITRPGRGKNRKITYPEKVPGHPDLKGRQAYLPSGKGYLEVVSKVKKHVGRNARALGGQMGKIEELITRLGYKPPTTVTPGKPAPEPQAPKPSGMGPLPGHKTPIPPGDIKHDVGNVGHPVTNPATATKNKPKEKKSGPREYVNPHYKPNQQKRYLDE